jgi:hypothetical protein
MSDQFHEFDTDADQTPTHPGQLSANGHWIFGSIYAVLALIGFSFGVWAGAAKPRPVETAEKQKDNTPKIPDTPTNPPAKPPITPPNANPNPTPANPTPMDPKPMDPEPKPEPEPKSSPKPDNGLASIGDGLKTAPGVPVAPVVTKAVSFKTDVMPVFQKYCISCHGALAGKQRGGLDLRSIAALMKGSNNGEVMKVGDPKKSTLYTSMLDGADTPMPPEGKDQPTEAEKKIIADWIASGAKPRRTTVRRRLGHRSRARLELTPGSEAG